MCIRDRVASLIDEGLTSLLKNFLVPQPSANDSLFDSATSPLSTFSAKIDMSHRLGLISNKLCRDIHLIRKIRNTFAHDIYGCSFENGSVKSRVDALSHSIAYVEHNEGDDCRTRFRWLASIVIWVLNEKVMRANCLNEQKAEWIYKSGEELKKEKSS